MHKKIINIETACLNTDCFNTNFNQLTPYFIAINQAISRTIMTVYRFIVF